VTPVLFAPCPSCAAPVDVPRPSAPPDVRCGACGEAYRLRARGVGWVAWRVVRERAAGARYVDPSASAREMRGGTG
jgi:hypothetical protein